MKRILPLSVCLASLTGPALAEPVSLPAYGADLSRTSLSGLSSGAYMTAQFHVIHSEMFVGAGIIAGGPYYCAGSYDGNSFVENAMNACMSPQSAFAGPNTPKLVAKARQEAQEGNIDDPANLQDDRIYIFTGASDKTVFPIVVEQAMKFYQDLGVPADQIRFVSNINAGHAIITDRSTDITCDLTRSPYINDCDFTQSHDILRHIYGELNPPAQALSGRMIEFRQSEFIDGYGTPADLTSMSELAYAYVPAGCETRTCKVHVAFHGCRQGAVLLGDRYYTTTGYNELADSNDIIVLYPQVQPSDNLPYNPRGCWDFWGYSSPDASNPDFYTKDAPQIRALTAMIERLGQPRAAVTEAQ